MNSESKAHLLASATERLEEAADLAAMAQRVAHTTMKKSTKRPRRGDDHYAVVAIRYLVLQADGVGRGIIGRIADRCADLNNGERPTDAMTKSWVEGATREGFLGRGTPGRAGRARGARLDEWIKMSPDTEVD